MEPVSDAELIAQVREGNLDAFASLYARHADAARALARRCARNGADADDLVSSSFEAVLGALQRGHGPEAAFRAYLFTTIRRAAARQTSSRVEAKENDDLDVSVPFVDPSLEGLERSLVVQAFQSLPERWQVVLWHTEVEGASAAEVAELLGVRPNAAAALAYRAREGLRQAYLRSHVATSAGTKCDPYVDKLGAYARDALSDRDRTAVQGHLDQCDRCAGAYAELRDVNGALVRSVAPLFLGTSAAAYLATTSSAAGGGTAAGWWLLRGLNRLKDPVWAAGAAAATVATVGLGTVAVEALTPDPAPVAIIAVSDPTTTTTSSTTTTSTTVADTTTTAQAAPATTAALPPPTTASARPTTTTPAPTTTSSTTTTTTVPKDEYVDLQIVGTVHYREATPGEARALVFDLQPTNVGTVAATGVRFTMVVQHSSPQRFVLSELRGDGWDCTVDGAGSYLACERPVLDPTEVAPVQVSITGLPEPTGWSVGIEVAVSSAEPDRTPDDNVKQRYYDPSKFRDDPGDPDSGTG